jgi:hypothetical protein
MRWQLEQHGWPVGQHYLEVGTIIEGPDPNKLRNPLTGEVLTPPLPINARALTQDAYDQMCAWYGPEFYHRLRYDPHTVQPKAQR